MPNYCKHEGEFRLVQVHIASGGIQVRKLCKGCGKPFDGAIGQQAIDLSALDEYETGYRNPSCARCGNPDTELHHYFPQALARKVGENPDDWPTEYLCAGCHGKWHTAVTPKLVTRRWEAPKP